MESKAERILFIQTELQKGNIIRICEMEKRFGVNERTIRRDISDIKAFLSNYASERAYMGEIEYDHKQKGFRYLEDPGHFLTKEEVLAISKILLDSRAFKKRQMKSIIQRLIKNCVPKSERVYVKRLIGNEEKHYVELSHHKEFMDKLWKIGEAILNHNYAEIRYKRPDRKKEVKRKIKPVAIMFNEFYFYMAAFLDDKEIIEKYSLNNALPTIYRVDRIKSIKVLLEKYNVHGMKDFEEGEFRKRMQFMYGGELKRVRFVFSGHTPEPILDRLPTARILHEENGKYIMEAEVYGKGFRRWFLGQESLLEIISETNLRSNLSGQ